MKKSMFPAILLITVLSAIGLILWGFTPLSTPPPPKERSLVLITDDDTGWFFLQLRRGVQSVCNNQNARVQTLLLFESRIKEQLSALKVDCALLYFSSDEMEMKVRSVLDQANTRYLSFKDPQTKGVRMDERAGATALALAVPSAERTIIVISGNSDFQNLRLDAACKVRPESPVLYFSPTDSPVSLLKMLSEAEAVLALDAITTQSIAQIIESKLVSGVRLYGYDPGEKRVDYLENGSAYALALPTPFTLGFNAARLALSGEGAPEPPARIVTKEVMYLSENVQIVFPLLQID